MLRFPLCHSAAELTKLLVAGEATTVIRRALRRHQFLDGNVQNAAALATQFERSALRGVPLKVVRARLLASVAAGMFVLPHFLSAESVEEKPIVCS